MNKQKIKNIIPYSIRLQLKLKRRFYQDWKAGYTKLFASYDDVEYKKEDLPYSFNLKQAIKQTSHIDKKIHNLQLAAARINQVTVFPKQIFSFWQIVGMPNAQNGFQKGRNIVNGVLTEAYGGGLCQISSILYHLSLQTGLNILERHHHSLDIYKEEDRFTPLGSDATVVYAYKDLRLQNPFTFPIRFELKILEQKELQCLIWSKYPLTLQTLQFERKDYAHKRIVFTYKLKAGYKKEKEPVTVSKYRI